MARRRHYTDAPGLAWCGQYILGGEDGHTPIPCYSLMEWGKWMASADRQVAWTGGEHKWVSTVFLGLDHRYFGGGPPLVFETMLFINDEGDEMNRYSSWEDAEIGHKAFVRKYLVDPRTRVKAEENDD